jgi:ketosteroid isomerase-like protein
MDDQQTRDHIKQHADAVARGDMDAVVADFSEDLRPQVLRSPRHCRSRSRAPTC